MFDNKLCSAELIFGLEYPASGIKKNLVIYPIYNKSYISVKSPKEAQAWLQHFSEFLNKKPIISTFKVGSYCFILHDNFEPFESKESLRLEQKVLEAQKRSERVWPSKDYEQSSTRKIEIKELIDLKAKLKKIRDSARINADYLLERTKR